MKLRSSLNIADDVGARKRGGMHDLEKMMQGRKNQSRSEKQTAKVMTCNLLVGKRLW